MTVKRFYKSLKQDERATDMDWVDAQTIIEDAGIEIEEIEGIPSKTESLTNKTIDNDLNTIKLPLFCSVIVYKAGTTYKAKNMVTGALLSTTSTTDAALVINAAIAATVSLPAPPKIGIVSNIYTCLTEIMMTGGQAGKHGVQLEGESRGDAHGTKLNFVPTSPLTNGIRFQMHDSGVSNLWIKGNQNVTNIIRLDGNGQRGRVDWCNIEGHSVPPVTGQIGILDAPTSTSSTYYWKFTNTQFNKLDTGIKIDNTTHPANAAFFSNLNFINTEVGIDCYSNSQMMTNLFFQAIPTVGLAAVRLQGVAFGCQIHNVVADLLTKANGGVVILESGATENTISGVYNSSASQPRVRNNSGTAFNQIGVYRASRSTQSGNGSTTVFNINHGYGSLNPPAGAIIVQPMSADAKGEHYVTISGVNIVITYTTAPVSGTNNLTWAWRAEVA